MARRRPDRHEESPGRSPGREAYIAWLGRHFGLAPVDDPGTVVEAARAELGEQFTAWLAPRVGGA
ncbi:hypothetical protein SBI_08296 [Streptomyces bingchenggensis BCW-1]|uniref:Uncharacterized protein n=1 Tax=Streptomyces bingchenggensis (strain BCW-1) TaxID=749414 RepID=D7BR64_STRBB|nr:hypothetical protein SBI_08296 [Streptomyces bingchenggensis BCW-1]